MNPHGEKSLERHIPPMPSPGDLQGMEVDKHYYPANRMVPYMVVVPPQPHQTPMSNSYRQDSTVCKACSRHLFRSEAVRCLGSCQGEFHDNCCRRQEWTCGTCKQQNSVSKEDMDKLTGRVTFAVDDILKRLAETDKNISGLRVDTAASKMSDNITIEELKNQVRNMNNRFELVEKQVQSLRTWMTAAMGELKNTIDALESKIQVSAERQTQSDRVDISEIQDTLNNACHVIVTEMSKSLDKLIEDKSKTLNAAEDPTKHYHELQLKSTFMEDVPRIPQEKQQKTSRLQQLASQYGI